MNSFGVYFFLNMKLCFPFLRIISHFRTNCFFFLKFREILKVLKHWPQAKSLNLGITLSYPYNEAFIQPSSRSFFAFIPCVWRIGRRSAKVSRLNCSPQNYLLPRRVSIHPQSLLMSDDFAFFHVGNFVCLGYAIVQCAGDTVFIPAGACHQVKHLCTNWARIFYVFGQPRNRNFRYEKQAYGIILVSPSIDELVEQLLQYICMLSNIIISLIFLVIWNDDCSQY